MSQLIFKETQEFPFCEISYYQHRIVLIKHRSRITVRLVVDLDENPFFTFNKKVYFIDTYVNQKNVFPEWFFNIKDKVFYEKINHPKFSLTERILLKSMDMKIHDYYKQIGLTK